MYYPFSSTLACTSHLTVMTHFSDLSYLQHWDSFCMFHNVLPNISFNFYCFNNIRQNDCILSTNSTHQSRISRKLNLWYILPGQVFSRVKSMLCRVLVGNLTVAGWQKKKTCNTLSKEHWRYTSLLCVLREAFPKTPLISEFQETCFGN